MAVEGSVGRLVGFGRAPLGTDPLSSSPVAQCPVWGPRKKKNPCMHYRRVGAPVFVTRSGRKFRPDLGATLIGEEGDFSQRREETSFSFAVLA